MFSKLLSSTKLTVCRMHSPGRPGSLPLSCPSTGRQRPSFSSRFFTDLEMLLLWDAVWESVSVTLRCLFLNGSFQYRFLFNSITSHWVFNDVYQGSANYSPWADAACRSCLSSPPRSSLASPTSLPLLLLLWRPLPFSRPRQWAQRRRHGSQADGGHKGLRPLPTSTTGCCYRQLALPQRHQQQGDR